VFQKRFQRTILILFSYFILKFEICQFLLGWNYVCLFISCGFMASWHEIGVSNWLGRLPSQLPPVTNHKRERGKSYTKKSSKPPRDACAANRSLTIFYPLYTQSHRGSLVLRRERRDSVFFNLRARPKITSLQFTYFEWRFATFGYWLNY